MNKGRKHLMERLFTTKEVMKITGVSLSFMKNLTRKDRVPYLTPAIEGSPGRPPKE